MRPHLFFFLLWAALLFSVAFFLSLALPLRLLLAANIATFLLFGVDKLIAGSGVLRAPESVLLTTAFLGGSLGALLGIHCFRHKTRRAGFQLIVGAAFIMHIGIAFAVQRGIVGT